MWKRRVCELEEHNKEIHELCGCEPPYKLYPLPTERKNYELRMKWIKMINRSDEKGGFYNPMIQFKGKDGRVCSTHFKDGKPTDDNPIPICLMGYDGVEKRVAEILQSSSSVATLNSNARKRKSSPLPPPAPPPPPPPPPPQPALLPVFSSLPTKSKGSSAKQKPLMSSIIKISYPSVADSSTPIQPAESTPTAVTTSTNNLIDENSIETSPTQTTTTTSTNSFDFTVTKKTPKIIRKINKSMHSSVRRSKMKTRKETIAVASGTFTKPLSETLLKNDKKCLFYTNLSSLKIFYKIHDNVKEFVRSRFYSKRQTNHFVIPKFHTPKKPGPSRKLTSSDELLLTLMKLRLGLLFEDLGDRFGVSKSCASKIFQSWIRALSLCLSSLIYQPEEENILNTTPERFRGFYRLNGIIDCTEIFIETPKSLELQSATWSEYKHHNTVKILISVLPNSMISYVSEPYTGRISDKAIVNGTEFLDTLPTYCSLMADKGFNIEQECAYKSIYLIVPPGRRGTSQMTEAQLKKTSKIAKARILVEQVIRRVKTFRILSNEVQITLLPQLNDIVIVCCAISNLKKPIMK
ncbi:uncharacterized protein [Clytia hemisphaerica]|uniref:uncharacterized protein n=1 Tax=Clytia hemisphaerica TaxID=252671 RepID=UPI0034D6CE7E